MAYTQEQINAALEAELALRPGTSYEDMLDYATTVYGLTPEQVGAAYASLEPDPAPTYETSQDFLDAFDYNDYWYSPEPTYYAPTPAPSPAPTPSPVFEPIATITAAPVKPAPEPEPTYTQEQINEAFALRRDEGFTDEQINEIANNLGLTEQNVLDARKAWLGTDTGQEWLSGQTPLQQDWNQTFWVGDFQGAQDVLNQNKLTPSILQSDYGITPEEINDVAGRYGVYPSGARPANAPAPGPWGSFISTRPDSDAVLGGRGTRASFTYGRPTAELGGWANRYTQGAAGNETLNAGNANYESELIKSLRQASSASPFSKNTGVTMMPSMTSTTPVTFNPGSDNAFDPRPFVQNTVPNVTSDQAMTNSIAQTQVPSEGWTVDQATTALANELALRPGSTEEALRIQALRYPGVTPELFQAAYQNVKGGGGGGVGTGTETWNQY